jgi:hypothetical protein
MENWFEGKGSGSSELEVRNGALTKTSLIKIFEHLRATLLEQFKGIQDDFLA